mmetsp:Transcript_41707/g.100417  ORF Transcript_41707/g.100417 Transcript_41707/m.100417 type:complete len:242 (+) Transcript_41707:625-1350(+)
MKHAIVSYQYEKAYHPTSQPLPAPYMEKLLSHQHSCLTCAIPLVKFPVAATTAVIENAPVVLHTRIHYSCNEPYIFQRSLKLHHSTLENHPQSWPEFLHLHNTPYTAVVLETQLGNLLDFWKETLLGFWKEMLLGFLTVMRMEQHLDYQMANRKVHQMVQMKVSPKARKTGRKMASPRAQTMGPWKEASKEHTTGPSREQNLEPYWASRLAQYLVSSKVSSKGPLKVPLKAMRMVHHLDSR